MFRQLRNRFLLLNMSIISLVMIASFAAIYLATYSAVQVENQNRLTSLSAASRLGSYSSGSATASIATLEAITFNIESLDGGGDSESIFTTIGSPNYVPTFSIVLDESGKLQEFASPLNLPEATYYQAAALATGQDYATITIGSREWMYKKEAQTASNTGLMWSGGAKFGQQQVTFIDVTETSRTLTRLWTTFLIAALVMLVVIFFISQYFADKAIAPLASAWEKQRRFVADASHELKTPLAIIDANIEVLFSNEEQTIASQKKWLTYIRTQSGRMSSLVGDLLYLARAESAAESTALLQVDLSRLVHEALLCLEAVIYENSFEFSQKLEPGVAVCGDGEELRRIIFILLDNAIKYTPVQGDISVALKHTRTQAVFSVQNSGAGIAKEDLPHIFDRFYRGDPSRTQNIREGGGYGLGLAIAKAGIERMGGRIFAESVPGQRTTFTFMLPLADNATRKPALF